MVENDLVSAVATPATVESVRAELAKSPQVPGLLWPPPRSWKWHEAGEDIRTELRRIELALASFGGSAAQRASLESHRRRVTARFARWKQIVFWSGWRPWQDREPLESE